jgi:uncharacterized protein with NRDE domain
MCLISAAWQCSDQYPFVFVGNRDEYHARPSAAADWWQDAPHVLAGRDLVAGGSWLGINRRGAFAVVTNRPDLPAPEQGSLSRGALVTQQLTDGQAYPDWLAQLELDSQRYGGFSLLAGTINPQAGGELNCYSGGNGVGKLEALTVKPGVFGLSNTALEDSWPKLIWLNAQIGRLLGKPKADVEDLFALLLRREPVPNADKDGVWARPFIVGDEYGTRSATVIVVNQESECLFIERRFGPGGVPLGETSEQFTLSRD